MIDPYRFGGTTTTDPDFASVVLLMHGDTAPAIDSSSYARGITEQNGALTSTTQSKFGGRSMFMPNNNSVFLASGSATYALGTGNFTIELYGYRDRAGTQNHIMDVWPEQFLLRYQGGELQFYTAVSGLIMNTAMTWSLSSWKHIAVERVGNVFTAYNHGVSFASVTNAGSLSSGANSSPWYVGGGSGPNDAFGGYIDDVRVTKGVARYNGNFTPHTIAHPNS